MRPGCPVDVYGLDPASRVAVRGGLAGCRGVCGGGRCVCGFLLIDEDLTFGCAFCLELFGAVSRGSLLAAVIFPRSTGVDEVFGLLLAVCHGKLLSS